MKTNSFRSTFLAGAAFVFGVGLTIPAAIAGPGPQYWRTRDKSTAVVPAPADRVTRNCTDARLVAVTETKPSWHNGRGPLVTREVGTRRECTSCDTPLVVMRPSGHNGRGPMERVEIRGKHDCTKDGCGTAVASVH